MKEKNELRKKQYTAAVLGLVVGDALGVPAEFKSREELRNHPVREMTGYGTHNQPAGTWSDDSSMVLATMEWFAEGKGTEPDYKRLMDKFSAWLLHGDYTPYGDTFDCGIATSNAVMNYGRGILPLECGGRSEYDNGNGSLMRILPAALWYSEGLALQNTDYAEEIYHLSALTHAHTRSKIGCLIYSKIIAGIIANQDADKFGIVEKSLLCCKEYFDLLQDKEIAGEEELYSRLWNVSVFRNLPESEIKSSGYVVDTLEAALWCFFNTENYRDCVLKAVNLGDDTDTVGAVAGGLAGLYYGMDHIPKEWIEMIPKKEWIMELAEKMAYI